MKKFIILLIGTIFLLLFFAYFKIFSGQSAYYKAIAANDSSVLVLNNFDLGRIRIITADTDTISFNLEGEPEVLAALEYENDGLLTKFGISSEWSEVSGTIIVPEGMLIDVTLSQSSSVTIDDSNGDQTIADSHSFLIDTSELNFFEVGLDGGVLLNGSGDLTVWDDEKWDDLTDNASENVAFEEGGPLYCGVGSQAIRDYCCVNENDDGSNPECDGVSHWIFDNSARSCSFSCEEINVGELPDAAADCGVGGQDERNACCAEGREGEYQGCIGAWQFNNSAQTCTFACDTADSVSSPEEGDSGSKETYDDPTSNYCAAIEDVEDQSLCCNDSLKNNLSSGPHPGFPDCIGTWYFDGDYGCEFECADRAEMIKILNEIKQSLNNNEE